MLVIGLTGGIASGKSAASDQFQALGGAMISADVLAREVVALGTEGIKALADAFSDSILLPNGELNRRALRERIFASAADRQTVDDLLHPLIRELSEARISEAKDTGYAYLIYEVPLLVETMQAERFDRVVVIDVPVQLQIDRLLKRDNTNIEQARAIIDSQASREQRLAIANDVIDNEGTLKQLHEQVETLHHRYTELAKRSTTT